MSNFSLNKYDIAILKWIYRADETIFQSDLPKMIGLDAKVVTKSLYKLEKLGLVKREVVVHNKRKTYKIKANKETILRALEKGGETVLTLRELFERVIDLPCLSCQYISRCYEGGFYDPVYCQGLANYIDIKSGNSVAQRSRVNR
ncbi:MAG: MarR family winged helix-turn-helix transcriptional regulator [Desulfurococcaceae archaeon]